MQKTLYTLAIVSTVVFGTPGVVLGQQPTDSNASQTAQRVEELASEGARAYRNGKYDEAIGLFKKAHSLEPVPNLLYNIAKCYEKQEQYRAAIEHYQQFAVAPEVDSQARKAAMKRIQNLREIADIKNGDLDGDQQTDPSTPEPAGPTATTENDRTPPVQPSQPVAEPDHTAAWWTMASGAVLIGGGAVVGLAMAKPAADDVTSGGSYADRKAARDDAQTYSLVADGLFAAGAVATGIGLYLYLADAETVPAKSASRTVVAPWVAAGSAGLGMSLDF